MPYVMHNAVETARRPVAAARGRVPFQLISLTVKRAS